MKDNPPMSANNDYYNDKVAILKAKKLEKKGMMIITSN